MDYLNKIFVIKLILGFILFFFYTLLSLTGTSTIILNQNISFLKNQIDSGFQSLTQEDESVIEKIITFIKLLVNTLVDTFTEVFKLLFYIFSLGAIDEETIMNNSTLQLVFLLIKSIDLLIFFYGIIMLFVVIRGNFTV